MGLVLLSMRLWAKYTDSKKKISVLGQGATLEEWDDLVAAVFQNHVIFDEILANLDIPTLLRIRRVCPSWNMIIVKKLRLDSSSTLTSTSIRPKLRFSTNSELTRLCKTEAPFFIRHFYFKVPHYSPLVLGRSLANPFLVEGIVSLKLAMYANDVPPVLLQIRVLANLKTLYLLRMPELEDGIATHDLGAFHLNFTFQKGATSSFSVLEKLEHVKLRNLHCARCLWHSTAYNSQQLAALTSFLNSLPNLRVLELDAWPGQVVQLVGKLRLFKDETIQQPKALAIRGRSLGDVDVKTLSLLNLKGLKYLALNLHRRVSPELLEKLRKGVPKECLIQFKFV